MDKILYPIYFYIPQNQWPKDGIPDCPDTGWRIFIKGIFCWTLQTYLRLNTNGFPCELVNELPTEGIVLAHRDSLPKTIHSLSSKLLIVCLKAERSPYPYAQLHVVQNPQEGWKRLMENRSNFYYIPLWPQPGLIPRDPSRGDRFENIAYFGHERNLAPELKSAFWEEQIKDLGMQWRIIHNDSINDYSEIDVVLAVRTFDRQSHNSKPATKLFNAWHAGVPAIVGYDSAFSAEYKSPLDYIQVVTIEDTIAALKRLRTNPNFRHQIVKNGIIRAEETQVTALVSQWQNFLTQIAIPAYEQWCKASTWTREQLVIQNYFAMMMQAVEHRFKL